MCVAEMLTICWSIRTIMGDSTLEEAVSPLTPLEQELSFDQQVLLKRKKRSRKRNLPFLKFPVYPMDEAVEHGSLSDSGLSTNILEGHHQNMTTLLRA